MESKKIKDILKQFEEKDTYNFLRSLLKIMHEIQHKKNNNIYYLLNVNELL